MTDRPARPFQGSRLRRGEPHAGFLHRRCRTRVGTSLGYGRSRTRRQYPQAGSALDDSRLSLGSTIMMTMARLRLGVGMLCVCLAIVLGYECFAPLPDMSAPPAQPARAPPRARCRRPAFQMPPQSSFAAIDARPIFDASRRPVAGPPDAILRRRSSGGASAPDSPRHHHRPPNAPRPDQISPRHSLPRAMRLAVRSPGGRLWTSKPTKSYCAPVAWRTRSSGCRRRAGRRGRATACKPRDGKDGDYAFGGEELLAAGACAVPHGLRRAARTALARAAARDAAGPGNCG